MPGACSGWGGAPPGAFRVRPGASCCLMELPVPSGGEGTSWGLLVLPWGFQGPPEVPRVSGVSLGLWGVSGLLGLLGLPGELHVASWVFLLLPGAFLGSPWVSWSAFDLPGASWGLLGAPNENNMTSHILNV